MSVNFFSTASFGDMRFLDATWDLDSSREIVFYNQSFEHLLIEQFPDLAKNFSELKFYKQVDFENAARIANNIEEGACHSLKILNQSWTQADPHGKNFLRLVKAHSYHEVNDFYKDQTGTLSRLSLAFASMDETIIPAVSMVIARALNKDNLLELWKEMDRGSSVLDPSLELRIFLPGQDEEDQFVTVAAKLKFKPVLGKVKKKGRIKLKGGILNLKTPLIFALILSKSSLATFSSFSNLFSNSHEHKELGTDILDISGDFSIDDPFDVHLVSEEHFFEPESELLNAGTVMASNVLFKSSDAKLSELLNRFKPHPVKQSDYFAFVRRAYVVPGVKAEIFHRDLIGQKDWVEATGSNVQYTGKTEDGFTVVKQIPFLEDVHTRIKLSSYQGDEVDSYHKLFPRDMRPELINTIELVETNEPVIEGTLSIAQHYNLPNKGVLILVDSIASIGVNNDNVGWFKRKVLTGIPKSVRLYEFVKETKYNAEQTRLFCKRFLDE